VDASVELVRHLTECVVNIQTTVARDHRSVPILGTERMGSGVVVDPGGLILTVNYAVMGGQTLQVSFLRGRRVRAEIVAQDVDIGVALLRIKRQGLTAAPLLAEGELERGQPVVTVASTGAQERRVSGGVITYLGEYEAHWEYLLENGIISNAANPGFGGGGLFTLQARLAGIVSLSLNELLRNSLSIPVDYYREHERSSCALAGWSAGRGVPVWACSLTPSRRDRGRESFPRAPAIAAGCARETSSCP
jgi:S1-C subfamily serine protease